jgi:hypothetical protein
MLRWSLIITAFNHWRVNEPLTEAAWQCAVDRRAMPR